MVGVNRYGADEAARTPILRVDPQVERDRRQRLQALRERRDAGAVDRALDHVDAAAVGNANLLPPIVEAVEAYATLGEISNRLRKVFGLHAEAFSF